jgi:hypothetical protein
MSRGLGGSESQDAGALVDKLNEEARETSNSPQLVRTLSREIHSQDINALHHTRRKSAVLSIVD